MKSERRMVSYLNSSNLLQEVSFYYPLAANFTQPKDVSGKEWTMCQAKQNDNI